MRALVDTNLPKALARWLTANGIAARHALDADLAQSADEDIWRIAAESGEVIFSKDQDFADLVLRSTGGPSVVWLRTGNGTTADLIAMLGALLPGIRNRLDAGDRLIEIR